MDSCHLFNFLFGTRKATSELRKCFNGSNIDPDLETRASASSRHARKSSAAAAAAVAAAGDKRCGLQAPPNSPLKQIRHNKMANLAATGGTGSSSCLISSEPISTPKSASVFSTSTHEIVIEEQQRAPPRACPSAVTTAKCGQQLANGIYPARLVKLDENNNLMTQPGGRIIVENPAHRLSDELGTTPGSTINLYENPLNDDTQVAASGHALIEQPRASRAHDKTTPTTPKLMSKSERIKNLVQTFELPAAASVVAGKNSIEEQTTTTAPKSPGIGRAHLRSTPPKTPPKSTRAKCLNWQLCLNRPTKIASLFQEPTFLGAHFFDKLEPLDRCSAAQVCRTWRNVLYANKCYWKDLVGVIDCTQLRREHLVECILNTVHTAKLKHTAGTGHRNDPPQLALTSAQDASALIQNLSQMDQDEIWRIQELCNRFTTRGGFGSAHGGGGSGGSCNNHTANNNNRNSMISNSTNSEPNDTTTQTHQHTATTTTTTSGIANSKSSSSQISSSTLSSVSLSSLLSPLSESSRVDSIREKLYTALDERGFESMCLFGATDDDIEDLASKTRPNGAQLHIRLGRLSNCAISDRGLEVFLATFGQLEELELTGCNEITNAIELKRLTNLRRLIVTDCINIADGFAQRLAEVLPQLDVLIVQAYHLTDAFLEYLSQQADTTRLRRLELPDCKEITNNSALTISKCFQQLEVLSLSGSARINDDGAEILAEHMKRLHRLDLGWMKMSDFALECLACDLRELRELVLDRNTQITDIGLSYLANMSNLSLLHVRWCPALTDNSIRALAGMRSLRRLSLAGLHQVTARGLLALIDSPWLEELELTNCRAVTGELLAFLSARLPTCNIIF